MRRTVIAVVLVLLLVGTGCTARVLTHSQTDAAASAQEYLTALIVDKDVDTAYSMMSDSARSRVSPEALRQSAQGTGNYGEVTEVVATAYEPVPGQAAIIIYLKGTGAAEPVYYMLQMAGTADTGYKADHFAWSPTRPPVTKGQRDLP